MAASLILHFSINYADITGTILGYISLQRRLYLFLLYLSPMSYPFIQPLQHEQWLGRMDHLGLPSKLIFILNSATEQNILICSCKMHWNSGFVLSAQIWQTKDPFLWASFRDAHHPASISCQVLPAVPCGRH